MAKKQEVVDTWGRLAERVNSQAATKSPQSDTTSGTGQLDTAGRKASVAEADAGEASALGGGTVRNTAKESSKDLDGPELDDVD